MEERIRILRMLEEGKITAEEAVRLLEAIKKKDVEVELEGLGGFITKIIARELRRIPKIVDESLKVSFSFPKEYERIEKGVNLLEVENLSGDVLLKNWDKANEVMIKSDGFSTVKRENEKLSIKQLSCDTEIYVSKGIKVEIQNVSGDVIVEDFEGKINVTSTSGDVIIERGSVEGSIKASSGDVIIKVSEDASYQIETVVEMGSVESDFLEKDGKIVIGKGENKLKIFAECGDIVIKKEE